MIDIGPLLSDCPFRDFCILVQGEREDEQLSISVPTDVSKTADERHNLGARD